MQKTTEEQIPSPKIILIRNTFPQSYGGGETYQLVLSKILTEHNFSPIIFSSSLRLIAESQKSSIRCQKTPFLKFQNWSGLKNFLLPLYVLWQIYLYFWYRRQFKAIKPQTIIIESRDDYLSATRAAQKLGIKVLWIDHMDFRSWVLQNVEQKYKNPIGKKILQTAKSVGQIIFISDYERQFFENLISKTPFRTFSNLTTIKNGAIDAFKDYQILPVVPQSLIYLGRLEDYKGIKELISAFSKIASDFPDAKLHLYGTGPLVEFCKAHQTSQIIYHGFTDQPLKQIASAAIFILPSYREGLSLALIDATMLGKAIIATRIDGNPEVVEHQKNGLLIPDKDTAALADAMRELLSNPQLVKKFENFSRKKYLAEFDFQKTIKKQLIPILEEANHE